MEEQNTEAIDERQDEGQEEKNVENQPPPDIEKWRFALLVLKEAVINAGVKDISEYHGEPLDLRWHLFSQYTNSDVVLRMLVKGMFGWINSDVSLIITAKWIVDEVESILNQPNATRILDFTEEERTEVLREHSRMILTVYVKQIPVVLFQLLSQAISDAVQAHIKTYVEPTLKDHWQSLGLPEDFTISPSADFNREIETIDEQFNTLREGLLGNKRAWLTDEKRANLDEEHEQLRSEYKMAKEHYTQTRRVFFAGKRNRTEAEWMEEWNTQSNRMFPTLNFGCLAEINSYAPHELAYIHLGDIYGYGTEYIRKLVTKASRLKPTKS